MQTLNTPEMRRALRLLGMRPSKSADEARELALAEVRALPVEERMKLALRLGRRDRLVASIADGESR